VHVRDGNVCDEIGFSPDGFNEQQYSNTGMFGASWASRFKEIHVLFVAGLAPSDTSLSRSAIFPSLVVCPSDACTAEAGSRYIISLAGDVETNVTAASAPTTPATPATPATTVVFDAYNMPPL